MAITLKRQLNDDEKLRVLEIHGRTCFTDGHLIPETDPIHFDHIRAFSSGGESEINNIAPMCAAHNMAKGRLPLFDFRVKLRLDKFFDQSDKQTLRHLLSYLQNIQDLKKGFGKPVSVIENEGEVKISSGSDNYEFQLHVCPATGWKYFYATLPIEILDSDDDKDSIAGLQPRYLINEKVFELFRHFQAHPVLQPSIGRVSGNKIVLFDGQHKIAGLLWNGRREFECKIYLNPDLRLLNQTNISAHDKFAQTRFYTSIMVAKLGGEFGADFDKYKSMEDGKPKTEEGFMTFIQQVNPELTKAEINKRFRSYLYNAILENPENKSSALISTANKSSHEKPLTLDMLSKSIFSSFLWVEPASEDILSDKYKREREIEQIIGLMNMIFDHALHDWNPKAGKNDDLQNRLDRICRSKSMMAWSELLRDAVCGKLDLVDAEDRLRPFYRDIHAADLEKIKTIVGRLVNWAMWMSPVDSEIDRILADNKSAVKEWFKKHGLTTGYLMGASA